MDVFTLLLGLLWVSLLCPVDICVAGQDCSGRKPVIDPPALVVMYGGPATASCRVQYNTTVMGWETTVGAKREEEVQQLDWSVDSVTDWSLNYGINCYAISDEYEQCLTVLPITIYMNKLTIIWFRGDTEQQSSNFTIEGDQDEDVTVRANLRITASREDHGASYCCAAQLDLNTAEPIPDTRSNSILLEVFYKFGVQTSITISVGDTLGLICRDDANPSSTYQWRHNDAELPGNNNDTLVIDSVTEDDEGVYECIIRNDQGEESKKMDVEVEMPGNQIKVIIGVVVGVTITAGLIWWKRDKMC